MGVTSILNNWDTLYAPSFDDISINYSGEFLMAKALALKADNHLHL